MWCQHHTSICDKKLGKEQILVATGESTVIYPVVVVSVDGIKCRVLLDSGSGSSYASSSNQKPTQETSSYRAQANRDDGLFNHPKGQQLQGEHLECQ